MTEVPTVDRQLRRREQTRRRLIVAARELISAKGVAGLRIADITDTADVGRGSFYNHFASKEDLVDAVVRETIRDLAAQIVAGADESGDAAVAASAADRRFIRLAYDDVDDARLFVNLAHENIFEDSVGPFALRALEVGVASGRFTIPNLEMALIVLTGSALTLMRLILDGRAPADADVLHAEAMLTMFGVPAEEAHRIARLPL
ncbi:helix-turn-helix domain-containing protein [Paraconexibacter sp. AEG42_29]